MIEQFLQWLAARPSSVALHESFYLWPLLESVHVLTLTLFVGFAAMLDLRLLGVAFTHVPVSKFAQRLMPWTIFAFGVMVISGVLVFYANPVHFAHNIFFRFKAILLILAGINAWVFHAGIWTSVPRWDRDTRMPRAARLAGAASLVLWVCIIFAGRLIAYDWFDCGPRQSATINWLSGCGAIDEP